MRQKSDSSVCPVENLAAVKIHKSKSKMENGRMKTFQTGNPTARYLRPLNKFICTILLIHSSHLCSATVTPTKNQANLTKEALWQCFCLSPLAMLQILLSHCWTLTASSSGVSGKCSFTALGKTCTDIQFGCNDEGEYWQTSFYKYS